MAAFGYDLLVGGPVGVGGSDDRIEACLTNLARKHVCGCILLVAHEVGIVAHARASLCNALGPVPAEARRTKGWQRRRRRGRRWRRRGWRRAWRVMPAAVADPSPSANALLRARKMLSSGWRNALAPGQLVDWRIDVVERHNRRGWIASKVGIACGALDDGL